MRAFHENDDETKKKEIKIFFAKALSEKVSRTLAWSLEEEENGCLSSLEELMQEVKEWRFQVLIFFGEWRDSDLISFSFMGPLHTDLSSPHLQNALLISMPCVYFLCLPVLYEFLHLIKSHHVHKVIHTH